MVPTEAEITAPVAEDATLLTVGFLLNGSGPGWIDEASLEVVPTKEAAQDDGAPLSDRQVEHLSAFAKLYGYVRWFSPYSEPNAPSWAEIAREGAIDAENAASPEALAAVLRTWFEPLAPGLVIRQGTRRTEPEGDIADASDLLRWQHEGVAFSNPIYQSQRVSAARAETWNADLGAGLAVSLPVTAPRSTLSVPAPGQASPAGPVPLNDRATRLGPSSLPGTYSGTSTPISKLTAKLGHRPFRATSPALRRPAPRTTSVNGLNSWSPISTTDTDVLFLP
ncbi:hypothetical protein [Brevundimonas sp.]|uniref:hypothetical protein n=1 Tax=Brevundimonas sp. TaxID=1871086 RepID=UPI003F7268E8